MGRKRRRRVEPLRSEQREVFHYRHAAGDHTSLSSDRVRVITEDASGMIWVGTDGGGLNRFNSATGLFTHYPDVMQADQVAGTEKILALAEGVGGTIWVGTAGAGLYRLDPLSGDVLVYKHDPRDPGSISSDSIRSIFEEPNGTLWVGTVGGGVNVLFPQGNGFKRFLNDPEDIHSIGNDTARRFFRDLGGTLWIATDGGLSQWVPEYGNFLNYRHDPADHHSLADDRVRTLLQDQGGVLWVGTSNGISKWNYLSDAFRNFQVRKDGQGPLKNGVVTSISSARDGTMWVGTYGGGLSHLDLDTGAATHYQHDPEDDESISSNRLMAVFVDRNGDVWAGTRAAGLNRLDVQSGKVQRYLHDPADPGSISDNGITHLFGDVDGTLWVGTYGGGLNRLGLADGAFRAFRHDPDDRSSLSSDRVLTLYRDSSGVLWVGTEDGGLNALNESSGLFHSYRHDPTRRDSLSSDTAWDITEGRDGSLWIGTNGGGLNRWLREDRVAGRDVFRRYGKQNGLLGATVQAVVQDDNGSIWISSNRGLSQINPENDQIRHFDSQNGLVLHDFLQGSRAVASGGELLFGSTQGFVSFVPDSIGLNKNKPPIVLTAYRRMAPVGHAFSTDRRWPVVELGYTDYAITFEFSALDYTSSDKNLYRYRLEGFDKDWVESGHYRRVTYTNLPAGRFQFHVLGSNNDGIWSEHSADLIVDVSPPPWRSDWAYAIYALFILSAILTFLRSHQRKIAQEVQYRLELENQVRLRTSELSERNADLVKLTDQLRMASVTDSLTGLKNRRYLDGFINPEIARVDRLVRDRIDRDQNDSIPDIFPGLFFMMIDLDGFKLINDAHGHAAGDRALIQVCEILTHCCRSSDTVVRWGGDEFLIVGQGSNRSSVEKLAERIRVELAATQYRLGDALIGRLSASIGVSNYPFVCLDSESLPWERVVAIADQAAYIAKENQRNAWVSIYPGPRNATMETFETISDQLYELSRAGSIDIRSSIQKELAVLGQKRESVSA